MSQFDLHSVLENLNSSEVEKQVLAVERAAEIVNLLAVKTVDALRKVPHRFLVAERLYRLGSAVVPPLEELVKESDDSETSILAATVLLRFGSKAGVPCLLDAVARDEEYSCLAASSLAAAGIQEAIEPIVERLRRCELQQVDLVLGLLYALEDLGSEIPSDLHQRFAAPDAPWQIRTMIKDSELSASRC